MTSRKVAKRGFSLDYIMWLFMRLSALALYAVGLTGLTAALIMGARTQTDISTLIRWTFFQNPSHVFSSDLVNLDGFINQFWQIMQITAVCEPLLKILWVAQSGAPYGVALFSSHGFL